MKKIVCEMCESSDFVKQDGLFVCQSCGAKYSVEEAKKLMVETDEPVPVKAAVTAPEAAPAEDGAAKTKNYLIMAQNALDASNNGEAENYCNKVLELDPQNYKAWLIKGQAAGWQTTLAAQRIDEALNCFEKAIEYAPAEQLGDVAIEANNAMQNLCYATGCLKLSSLENYPTAESLQEYLAMRLELLGKGVNLRVAYNARVNAENEGRAEEEKIPMLSLETTEFLNRLDEKTYSSSINIWNSMIGRYNGESWPGDYLFDRCLKEGSVAILMMDNLVPRDITKVEEKKKPLVLKAAKEAIKMKDTYSQLKSYRVDFSGGIESHPVNQCVTASYQKTLADEISALREKIRVLDPNAEIAATGVEATAERNQAKAEKRATQNGWACWLLGILAWAVFYFVTGRLQAPIYKVLGFREMTSYIVSALRFLLSAVPVAFLGFKFVVKYKKNIEFVPVIIWSIVIGAIMTFVMKFISEVMSYVSFGRYIVIGCWIMAFVIVMFIADGTGTLIKEEKKEKQK